ncbi:MAG TPA: NrtA/SsuA/CpmA family ABC transporter substrate-binding protein [Candidatus Bathyarchaeia archaeon]
MSRTKRIEVLAMVVVVIVIMVSGSFLYLNSQQNFFGKTQTITIGNLPLESSGLLYVADKQGFFEQNGLKVIMQDYDTGIESNNALLRGEVDIAGGSEYPLVRMAFQNSSVQAISVINKSEIQYLVARKDHAIENASDLKGKTIALIKGTISEFYLSRFLSLNGINANDVTTVNMTLTQSLNALVNGVVDAIVNWQPYTNSAENSLGSNAVIWSVEEGQPSYGVLTCRTDWVAAHSEVVNHFLRSISQAEDFIRNNPIQAKTIVKNQMNYTDAYMETVWKQNQYSISLDQSLVGAMEGEARWMISNNLTSQTVVPNFVDFIYLEGLMSVKPESVNIIH